MDCEIEKRQQEKENSRWLRWLIWQVISYVGWTQESTQSSAKGLIRIQGHSIILLLGQQIVQNAAQDEYQLCEEFKSHEQNDNLTPRSWLLPYWNYVYQPNSPPLRPVKVRFSPYSSRWRQVICYSFYKVSQLDYRHLFSSHSFPWLEQCFCDLQR